MPPDKESECVDRREGEGYAVDKLVRIRGDIVVAPEAEVLGQSEQQDEDYRDDRRSEAVIISLEKPVDDICESGDEQYVE